LTSPRKSACRERQAIALCPLGNIPQSRVRCQEGDIAVTEGEKVTSSLARGADVVDLDAVEVDLGGDAVEDDCRGAALSDVFESRRSIDAGNHDEAIGLPPDQGLDALPLAQRVLQRHRQPGKLEPGFLRCSRRLSHRPRQCAVFGLGNLG